MSYRYDSDIVLLNRLDKTDGYAKAELYESYDRLKDLAISGSAVGGSGMAPFSSLLVKLAQAFSPPSFLPTIGTQAINIPGTSYYSPIYPGTGITPGGQSSFGLGPYSAFSGFAPAGSAAGFDPSAVLGLNAGFGNPAQQFSVAGLAANAANKTYSVAGQAAAPGALGAGLGLLAGAGFGRSYVLPLAGLVSGLGGLLTTIASYVSPSSGLAAITTGATLNGLGGALNSTYQGVSSKLLANADTILSNKIKNLEMIIKAVDAQKEVIKKNLKDSLEGDKKAVQDL